ncbi:hypothetical protein ASG01_02905 [Chryseobacterium sp. Leaf180]|uniref:hypothetical protein n=1 Tax=Chryseobacterium sp. Leaf180 TaxID=1736289 RepID=UPI0006F556A2|nr:hypothetical protein [Chryseobacterium sp. Leaf180]KQR94830.1 hypothetical protein ASG01_02905 [Chryseobacterium sp. Leaf180]
MQKLNKFNQYLLEKYPTVWNTKLAWMLLAAFIFHLLFFVVGYLSHVNPETLQAQYVKDDYFRHGLIFVHIIISVLMIVVWLIMMFKNNAFKNFYPQSRIKIFGQFVQYFIIIFASTTFYFSYMTGFKMFINNRYPDSEMVKNIETVDRASAFLSQNASLYDLRNRLYPEVFFNLYCETNIRKIDRTKKYFVSYDRVYQFYRLYTKISYLHGDEFTEPQAEKKEKKEIVYSLLSKDGKSKTNYYKKEVVDVSPYINFTGFSYYNYSEIFYDAGAENETLEYYPTDPNRDALNIPSKRKQFEINRKTADLLNKNDIKEIEKLLSQFLSISKKFGIKNNLNAQKWAQIVYAPKEYPVRYFIKSYKNKPGTPYEEFGETTDTAVYAEPAIDSTAVNFEGNQILDSSGEIVTDSVLIKDFNPDISKQISPEEYVKQNLTEYYYYNDDLKNFLASVDEIKSFDYFTENIHLYLWISFFLSVFILSFRITGLKSVLFSAVSAGVLTLSVILIAVLYQVSAHGKVDFFAGYLTLIISLLILIVPIFFIRKFSKKITSIFVNLSLTGFVLFVFLILGIISIHQRQACYGKREAAGIGEKVICHDVFDDFGLSLSYLILILGFIFVFLYSAVLMKWKARPE